MAQTGYTPILIYSSSTASAAPTAGNLTNSSLGSELAINITDGKLFYKDNANAIQVIGWKVVPTTAGGTGLISYSQGDLLYYDSGTTFTTLAKNTTASRYLSNGGTNNNPSWAQVDLTNGVTGALPTANGGTNLTSFTANGVVYASSTSALSTGSAIQFDGSNLGLNLTPSASWWSSMRTAQFGRAGNGIFGATGDDEINVGANVISTGSGTYIYGATDTASLYRQVASQHVWYYAASGTAGNAITFTESMRITSAGNLKINGTANRGTTEGTGQLVLFNGTAPVGTLTNGVSFYAAAGEARVMDAAGNSTLLSPHDQATNEWIFHSKHTPTGKVLRIDVEKMLRFINNHFDLNMIEEFFE